MKFKTVMDVLTEGLMKNIKTTVALEFLEKIISENLNQVPKEFEKDYIENLFDFDKPYTETMWNKYDYLRGKYYEGVCNN